MAEREHLFLDDELVEVDFGAVQHDIRVVGADESHQFGRVEGGDLHVGLELHPCHLRDVVKYLRILAAAKRKVETGGMHLQRQRLGPLQQVNRVVYTGL